MKVENIHNSSLSLPLGGGLGLGPRSKLLHFLHFYTAKPLPAFDLPVTILLISSRKSLRFGLVRRNEILNLNSVNARSHEGA